MNAVNETPLVGAFSYSLKAHQTAGWNRGDEPFAIGSETITHGQSGTDMTVPKVLASLGTADGTTIVGWLRNACPTITAAEGLRAVRLAQAAFQRETERAAAIVEKRRAVTMMEWNGAAPAVMGAEPEAFPTRNHESVATRSRKGVVSSEVKRRGNAAVIGGTFAVPPSDPDAASDDRAVLARTMARVELDAEHVKDANGHTVYGARKIRAGRVAIDVTAVADRCYGAMGLPEMIGTETIAYAQIVDIPAGGDPADCRVAVGRSYLSGVASDPTVDAFVADTAIYHSQTRREYRRAAWNTRVKIGTGPHRATDARDSIGDHPSRVRQTGTWPTATTTPMKLHALISGAADREHRFHGHTLVVRPKPKGKASTRVERAAATERNKARNIGTVAAPETSAGWFELLTTLEVGERITVVSPIGKVTVSRGKDRYLARDKREGRAHNWRARTVDSLAIRLA